MYFSFELRAIFGFGSSKLGNPGHVHPERKGQWLIWNFFFDFRGGGIWFFWLVIYFFKKQFRLFRRCTEKRHSRSIPSCMYLRRGIVFLQWFVMLSSHEIVSVFAIKWTRRNQVYTSKYHSAIKDTSQRVDVTSWETVSIAQILLTQQFIWYLKCRSNWEYTVHQQVKNH